MGDSKNIVNDYETYFQANRQLWDKKTPVHIGTEFYDLDGFKRGQTSLRNIEIEEVGEVRSKSLLHLQCHFGMDTLSWARRGARVTGIDLSPVAISEAKKLAKELKLEADFLCANVYELTGHLKATYDIVFTSYGVIGWLPSLEEWAETICAFLKPGGIFYIVEFHPFVWMFDEQLQEITHSYFNEGVIADQIIGSYADRTADIRMMEYGWNHSLSDIYTFLTAVGLEVAFLHEFPYSTWNCFSDMKEIATNQWVNRKWGSKVPYLFSMKASLPQ